jgi:hypothetical protein
MTTGTRRGTEQDQLVPTARSWFADRAVPLAGSAFFFVVVANYVLWWIPLTRHFNAWWVPGDFWPTYFATNAFVSGHWSSVYASHNGFLLFPGILVVLSPLVSLAQHLHMSIGLPYTAISNPTAWLVVMPADIAAGCVFLFAADALARYLCVPTGRRVILVVGEMIALWDVVVWLWHPEDVLAVAFTIWAILAAFDKRWSRCGWMLGLAIAFQPLSLLALAPILAMTPRASRFANLFRSIVPALILTVGPLLANPRATLRAIVDQPSSTILNHATPWVRFAPQLGHGVVAAGPVRLVALIAAFGVGWALCMRSPRPEVVFWVVAAAFVARSFFEAVMVCYYVWPALAVGLVLAARSSRTRFVAVCAISSFAAVFAPYNWRNEWGWWSVLIVCVGTILLITRPELGIRSRTVPRCAGNADMSELDELAATPAPNDAGPSHKPLRAEPTRTTTAP